MSHRLRAWLEASPPWRLTLVACLAGFSTYFCMYAFRKPFAAATFAGQHFLDSDLELKTALVISQLLGYVLSKYLGIKICSEVPPERRAYLLVLLIACAEAALVVFALTPPRGQVMALFLNGLPLGMVWGLVVWHLEGRRSSEILLATVSCSFIVSSGAVKDVGRWMLDTGDLSEHWMLAATGFCFLPLFLSSVWLLQHLPPPNAADIAARCQRQPMRQAERGRFVRQFLPGLILLCAFYFLLTAYRDYRDNFQAEILQAWGQGALPATFSVTEVPITLLLLAAMAALGLVRDNRRALLVIFAVMGLGLIVVGLSTLALAWQAISGLTWLFLVGLGAYLAYPPFNALLFDRLIAATRFQGTAVFAIYLADATGYSEAILLQLYKDFSHASMGKFEFFRDYSYVLSVLGCGMLLAATVYFSWRTRRVPVTPPNVEHAARSRAVPTQPQGPQPVQV